MPARAAVLAGVASGVIATACGLAVALATTLFTGSASNPVTAIGSWAIDLAPQAVREQVIQLFGTGDKPFLITLIVVVLALLSALAGLLQQRRPPIGALVLTALALIGLVAVLTRDGVGLLAPLPVALGLIVALVVLRALLQRFALWQADAAVAEGGRITTLSRRQFFGLTAAAAVGAAVVGVGAQIASGARTATAALREAVRLPAAASPAPAVPAGAELDVDGLTPYLTPNEDFYRIDTALVVPEIDPSKWRLRITGDVQREVEFTFDQLLAMPLVEETVTLTCVSNEIGGDLAGNAVWRGVPIRDLLAQAVPASGADMVLSKSTDGFTAGTPLTALTDADRVALIAVGMNGEPLPLNHGFPARMVVAGLYGYVSATKWVTELEVTRFANAQGYWVTQGWAVQAPIKLASRIDTPREGIRLRAGRTAIAGVAWEQHVGVDAVDVQIDGGDWQRAQLADTTGPDTWRQWRLEWDAAAGDHTLKVRATNAEGEVQTSDLAQPIPDGATGLHTVKVTVA